MDFPLAQLEDIYAMVTGSKPFNAHDALTDGSVLLAYAATWFPASGPPPIVAPPGTHATVAPFPAQLKAIIDEHKSGKKTAATINWGGIVMSFLQWLLTQLPNLG